MSLAEEPIIRSVFRTWNEEWSWVRKFVLVPRVRIRLSAIVMSISSPRIISALQYGALVFYEEYSKE